MDPNFLPSLSCHSCHMPCSLLCHCWSKGDTEHQQGLTRPEHQVLPPAMSCSPLALSTLQLFPTCLRISTQGTQPGTAVPWVTASAPEAKPSKSSQAQQQLPLAPHPAPRGCFLELCHHTDLAWSTTAPSVAGEQEPQPKKSVLV